MTEVLTSWENIKNDLANCSSQLAKRQGAKEQLEKSLEEEKALVSKYKEEQILNEKAKNFLQSEIFERRKQAIDAIESMGTSALKIVYGSDYKLKFNTYDEKRAAGKSTGFNMDIQVVSDFKGKEFATGLFGERGGGVIETVSFALRIAALEWQGYEGPLLLDEAYKSISNDSKLEKIAQFLRYIADETGRQIIFATHKAEVFGQIADNIIYVKKENGIADVENITYEELKNKMEEHSIVDYDYEYDIESIEEENETN